MFWHQPRCVVGELLVLVNTTDSPPCQTSLNNNMIAILRKSLEVLRNRVRTIGQYDTPIANSIRRLWLVLVANRGMWVIPFLLLSVMMTSSNGNLFRVTGPLCGEFTGPGEFHTQRPVTRSFDVYFDLRLNKWLSKQPWGWWFEMPIMVIMTSS